MSLRHPALEHFSTAETAMITGVPNDTLRTWRARGLMPEDKHWTGGYDSLQVCALAIRKVMVDQGESPRDTARIGPRYAHLVLWAALQSHLQPDEAAALIGKLFTALPETSVRFLISWDSEPYLLTSDIHSAIKEGACGLRIIGLHAMGHHVAAVAPKPLLRPSSYPD